MPYLFIQVTNHYIYQDMIKQTDIVASINIKFLHSEYRFPENDNDKISSIATTFHTVQDNKPVCICQRILKNDTEPSNVHSSHSAAPHHINDDELKLISDWIELIKEKKPKIIIGWYIFNLDYMFLRRRSIKLGIGTIFSEELGYLDNSVFCCNLDNEKNRNYSIGKINKLDLMRYFMCQYITTGRLEDALNILDIPLPIYDKTNPDKYAIDLCLAYAEIFYKIKFIENNEAKINHMNYIKKMRSELTKQKS
jgi:DNA polymerase elongation subunit (family B)